MLVYNFVTFTLISQFHTVFLRNLASLVSNEALLRCSLNFFNVYMCARTFAGTRFRPLSLNIPKPLFPLAGQPMVHHPISACKRVHKVLNS